MSYPATVKFLPDLTIYIFYLATQMDRSEYVRIKINDILTEVIDEYNLQAITQNVWVYFEIVRGCYGLTQSGKLANYLLRTRPTRQVIMKLQQPQDYGNTPGVQYNFPLLLMILELNMWGKKFPAPPPSPPRTL